MNKSILTFLLFTLTSPLLSAQQNPVLNLDTTQREAFGISSSVVQMVKQSMSKPYPAKVQVPNAQLQVISSPLQGTIESLLVAEGETVSKGQLLAKVRSPGLLELQTAYLETLTRRQLSSETLARDSQLHKEGIIAKRRFLETKSRHKELLTAEQRDRQTLTLVGMSESAINKLARNHKLTSVLDINSPISGVVLEQIVTAGQRLAVSDPLYRMGYLSPLWVEVHVPLDALGNIGVGDNISISDKNLQASIITVGRMVHGTDQGVLVRAEISTGTEHLRPGQFVEARLSHAVLAQAIRLPAAAVVRVSSKDSVFVARSGGYELMPVQILSRDSEAVLVNAELQAGDRVVTSGTAALKAAFAAGVE